MLRAVAQDERSQWRNRELATERLVESLRQALKVERRRRPTKPTKALARAAPGAEAPPQRHASASGARPIDPKFLRQPYESLTARVIGA